MQPHDRQRGSGSARGRGTSVGTRSPRDRTATRWRDAVALALGIVLLAACGGAPVGPGTATFANPMAISVPAAGHTSGPAGPYPGSIIVAGLATNLVRVTVTLVGVSHAFPDDLDVLLVAPNGDAALLMSDAGGADPVAGLTLTFDDAAATGLPDAAPLASGTFRPTDHLGTNDGFPAPAPKGPYAASLAVFDGIDPNGVWKLFVVDDVPDFVGSIAGGWSLTLTTD